MNNFKKSKLLSLLIFAAELWSTSFAIAADFNAADRNSPTAFLRLDVGLCTFKSEFIESNDTGTVFSYGFGFYAGEERNIGVLLNKDQTSVNFALNDGSMTSNWQDLIIRYRLGGFYFGVVLSNLAMKLEPGSTDGDAENAEDSASTKFDITGSGYGAHAGFVLGFGRMNSWFLDVTTVSISEARDLEDNDVSFGSRTDIDTGVVFHLTRRAFDLIVGYKNRTYPITVGESFSESQSSTYLGFRFNSFF